MDLFNVTKIFLKGPGAKNVSSKDTYSILLLEKGTCTISFDDKEYSCNNEDIILMKPQETLTIKYSGCKNEIQILWLQLTPALLKALSKDKTDLEKGFNTVPFHCAVIHSVSSVTMLVRNLMVRLIEVKNNPQEYAYEIFEEGLLSMIIVMVLRACKNYEIQQHEAKRTKFLVDDLFVYIKEHLLEDISLEVLEKKFFVSKEHMAREFKKQTGETIHGYILKSRLQLCCRYISEGLPINQVYELGGFGSYNHFFSAFKKEYNLTPKEYYLRLQSENKNLLQK